MIFAVTSDVFYAVPANQTEDGVPLEGLVFYVIAEFEDGRRLAHNVSFRNGERWTHPEDGFVGWVRDNGEAEARAEALCVRITNAVKEPGDLDMACWNEIDPAYGSAAYQGLDIVGYFRARDIRDAVDAGEVNEYEADRLLALL